MCPLEQAIFDKLPPEAQLNLSTAFEHYIRAAPEPNGAALVWGLSSAIEAVLRVRVFAVIGYADALRRDRKWQSHRSLGELKAAIEKDSQVAKFICKLRIEPFLLKAVLDRIVNLRNDAAHGRRVDFKLARLMWDDVVKGKEIFQLLHTAGRTP